MWWILRWNFWACKQRVSGGENISAHFSPPTMTVQWDPSKITLNFAISKFVSHRHKIPWQFCLRAFVAANFAGHIFRREFRWQFFSPAPIFRRRQFFAGAVFRRHRFSPHCPFMLPSKTPTRLYSRDIRDSSLQNPRKTNFRGRARSFRPPPLCVEDPHPTGRSPDPKS